MEYNYHMTKEESTGDVSLSYADERRPESVLNNEFAARVNAVAGLFDDNIITRHLYIRSQKGLTWMRKDERKRYLPKRDTPKEWVDFLDDLNSVERGRLIAAIGKLRWRGLTFRLGDLRVVTIGQMTNEGISFITATFLKEAFKSSKANS